MAGIWPLDQGAGFVFATALDILQSWLQRGYACLLWMKEGCAKHKIEVGKRHRFRTCRRFACSSDLGSSIAVAP
jgi:hypothetical protein